MQVVPYWGEIQALITKEKDAITALERAVRVVRAETTVLPVSRQIVSRQHEHIYDFYYVNLHVIRAKVREIRTFYYVHS